MTKVSSDLPESNSAPVDASSDAKSVALRTKFSGGEFTDGKFIDTERGRFHFRTHGQPSQTPLLLLHGSFAGSRWWEPFFAILPDELFAIALDLRGCGQSVKSSDGYAIAAQAEDLWSIVQAMELRDFDLVAHSSGGAIAIEFLLNHPDLAQSLILVDSVPVEGVFTPVETLMLLEEMKDDDTLLRRSIQLLMPSFQPDESSFDTIDDNSALYQYTKREFFEQIILDAGQMAPQAFAAVAQALGQWNRFADAHKLTLPALILWGDQDQIIDRDAITRTLIAIPGANNLEVLRGVGHSPMIEAPLLLAERILDFITDDFGHFEEIRDSAS